MMHPTAMKAVAAAGRLFATGKTAPLIFYILLPVLVVRVKFIAVASDAAALWPWPYFGDTRSWWKAVAVVGIGGWMAFHAALLYLSGWRPRDRRLPLFIGAAAGCILLSTFFSPFPKTAWLGYTNLYEGCPVLLSYVFAVWYAAEMPDTPGWRLHLVRIVGCVCMLEGFHGMFENAGVNFWMTSPGRWLMGGGENKALFAFADSHMAYGTVFQPNHYGMLMAMLTILASGMVFAEARNCWKAFWLFNSIIGFAAVIFSNSRTALAVCGCMTVAVVVWCALRRYRLRTGMQTVRGVMPAVFLFLAFVAGFFFMAAGWFDGGDVGKGIRRVTGRMRATAMRGREFFLRSVELRCGAIVLTTADGIGELARRENDGWSFRWLDRNGETLKLDFAPFPGGRESVILPLRDGRLRLFNDGGIRLVVDSAVLWYHSIDDELFAVDPKGDLHGGKKSADAVRFGGYEEYLGGRGQTWGYGLALVPLNPWFGTGPGTFGLVFPNHEILLKQRYLDSLDEDKGHGVWVTFLVQLGVFGAITLALIVIHALRPRPGGVSPLGMALTWAVVAYLFGSITNDSTVGVTPVFCVLLGLLAAENRRVPDENGCS